MEDNWYDKLAKAGWLGTKAQVSSEYGNPAWKSADSMGAALKRASQKTAQKKEPAQEEAGS